MFWARRYLINSAGVQIIQTELTELHRPAAAATTMKATTGFYARGWMRNGSNVTPRV